MARSTSCLIDHTWGLESLSACPICGATDEDTTEGVTALSDQRQGRGNEGPDGEAKAGGDASRIGRYRILGELGRGAVGIVFRAYDTANNREVALKTLHKIKLERLQRFKSEFRILSQVAHPNLVSLYELVSDGNVAYFTMELLEGESFLHYVLYGVDGKEEPREPKGGDETIVVAEPSTVHTEVLDPRGTEQATARYTKTMSPHGSRALAGLPARAIYQLSESQLARLRDGLRQLVTGVAVIHDAGVLHRDLKPSNVMVTRDGTVKILDFGLALPVEGPLSRGARRAISGTPGYMAPEQAGCKELSAASDWYAVGVMIYQALTGQLPIRGRSREILERKQSLDPPSPNQIGAGAPEDLNALSIGLLARDPARRPKLPEVLGVDIARGTGCIDLVGRASHLGLLADCLSKMQDGVSVFVHGRSGFGKSTLVEQFLSRISIGHAAVILRGRCYERESVPYKAWDTLIDALAEFLSKMPRREAASLIPDGASALAQVFPALQNVEVIASAGRGSTEALNQQELRRRGFGALRQVLTRLARQRPLILYIDDLQWGDVDSATLLAELLSPPAPPPLLFLGCYRSDEASASQFLIALAELEKQGRAPAGKRKLEVGPLGRNDSLELATQLLGPSGTLEQAATIAEQADGSPFFIVELVKHARDDETTLGDRFEDSVELVLDEVLWSRVKRCSADERRLLEVIAVAGQPTRREVLFQAAGVIEQGMTLINLLQAEHFIRSVGAGHDVELETYHDRVRESVVGHLSRDTIESHHRALALTLEASGAADAERLAYHFHGGHEHQKAEEYYRVAANQAAAALAFEQAAYFFRFAIELHTGSKSERLMLQTRLADALANAGRGKEAAEEYLQAAIAKSPPESIELHRRGAMQYLHCGYVDEGIAALESVLSEVGMRMPKTTWRAALSGFIKGLRIASRGLEFRERPARDVPEELLSKIDICWFASLGFGVADPILAVDFARSCLLLSLRAGEPYRIARAICMESITSCVTLRPRAGERRATRLLDLGEELAHRVDEPHALATVYLMRGVLTYLSGYWSRARGYCRRATEILRSQCTGVTWELDTANTFSLWSMTYMGQINELRERRRVLLEEARDRRDLYAKSILGTYVMSYDRLGEDNPEAARQELAEARAELTRRGFQVRHHNAVLAETLIDIYCGRGEIAWKNIEKLRWTYRLSGLTLMQHVRIDIIQSHGRSALAAAAAAKKPGPFLRSAARDARRLAREKAMWGTALSQLIRAGVAAIRRDEEKAVAMLQAAARTFDDADMSLYAASARWQLGRIVGGDEGRRLASDARLRFIEQNVARPEKMRDMLAPGFSAR